MHKMKQYPAILHVHSPKNKSELNSVELNSVKLSPKVDEWVETDHWISAAIEWKRSEIIKQQMTSHINKMKTLRFKYHT